MKTKSLIALSVAAIFMASCSSFRKTPTQTSGPVTINLALTENPQAEKYANLEYGIRLNVQDNRADKRMIQIYDASAVGKPVVNVYPEISSFVPASMRQYMRTMGFNMDADVATDYMMQVTVKEFHTDWLSGIGWNGTVIMEVKIFDHSRTVVYPATEVVGRASVYGNAQSANLAQQAINKAYVNALADVDWDRVAYFLHRENSPKQEANKKVTGEGNTALEHLTVHFRINSRPQGADVYYRIISETPEVKAQSGDYLETTPVTDLTRTLNIKGLTYNNAGNVQLEIRCEKNGYYSQLKRFSLLTIIDQNDISWMFNLVKEDE